MSAAAPKSLKDQNRWQLWLTIAANVAAFYGVAQSELLAVSGINGLLPGATNILPVGLALVVTSVANGLLSAEIKAQLVFLRVRHALPGHRAFSELAGRDPRIDVARLRKLLGNKMPSGADEENRAWYRFFKEVESDPAVLHIHREFLFTRDYAGLSFLYLLVFGGAIFVAVPWKIALAYVGVLILQFVLVRHAAATYGHRFVCTVLARKAAKPAQRAGG